MKVDIDYQAQMLAQKVKHYLITTMGRVADEANADEFYRALCYALREEIMINWSATVRTIKEAQARIVYYISMEYMPGRILSNNITNISAQEIVRAMVQKLGRSYQEIASREFDPGLGNGGLGRLASCLLDSLATLHYPSQGYGLRYQYGIFEQQIWGGVQVEAPDCWLLSENPWEFRRDLRKVQVKFGGKAIASQNIHGDEIYDLQNYEEVWAVPYDIPIVGYSKEQEASVLTLRLWSTKESPRNFQLQKYNAGRLDQAAENTALTDVLYPSDWHDTGKRVRLKQEFLLVSASLQDIIRHYLTKHDNFRSFADKVRIQINDTHPALVIPELMHLLTKVYDLPWKIAWEITNTSTSYTNHTVLTEALEQWDHSLMNFLLPRQTRIIEKINYELCSNVRKLFPGDEERVRRMSIVEEGRVRMANLSIWGSHAVNGVAALHTEILKKSVFKDFYEMQPQKFFNVTNGVTQRRWLLLCNPDLSAFITKRIGDGWISHFEEIEKLSAFTKDPESQKNFLEIKRQNKIRLIDFLRHHEKQRDERGDITGSIPLIDPDSLFDVQIKRIHEYKRQLMNALHLVMLYQEIKANPGMHGRIKRTIFISGKAAASYETAKEVIRLIYCLARVINKDPDVNHFLKIIFIENYNVTKAQIIIPAADLSEQISTAGMEASGTGNMKLSMNGALTIGTEDGANVEMRESVGDAFWPFCFGAKNTEITALKGKYNPQDILKNDHQIAKAVNALIDDTFASSEEEKQSFRHLYNKLINGQGGEAPDRFFVLYDLRSYYETQKKVEKLFVDKDLWAEFALQQIAHMGPFTTDRAIETYAKKIWNLDPMPLNKEILAQVRREYSEIDVCRVY